MNTAQTPAVLDEVAAERVKQEAKWGQQNHPSFSKSIDDIHRADFYGIVADDIARQACEEAFQGDRGSYAHIFMEEAAEAICATTIADLRTELIQVAAVAVAWIESIDRNESENTTV